VHFIKILIINFISLFKKIYSYFTDPNINIKKNDNIIFRIYLDTCLQIIYVIIEKIVELNFIKEEDISLIPVLNKDHIKRENSYDELKNLEKRLRNEIKEKKYTEEELIFANQIMNRIKIRRLLMKIIFEQVLILKIFKLVIYLELDK